MSSKKLAATSHALRVRGLKLSPAPDTVPQEASHALRVRGLKLKQLCQNTTFDAVARSTRAWIETGLYRATDNRRERRTLYACVD